MAKKRESFNLSQIIRDHRKSNRGASVKDALAAITKAHSDQTINESTFKATFYKIGGAGKHKVVKRRKPGRVVAGGERNHSESIMRAGLHFIRLAGSVEAARERLVGLEELIETAKAVE